MKVKAKILHLDIETAPVMGVVWGLWNNNLSIDHISADWYILCYAAKWHKTPGVLFDNLLRYPKEYKKDKENDYNVLLTLRDLLDEADIVVAHNGKKFDIPKINARFLKYGITPPSPFRIVDTLKAARKNFALTSNKLDYIARYLGIGRKSDTGGITLWTACMKGDPDAWKIMINYNIKDVKLLEQVYIRLLPWIDDHPNLGVYEEGDGTYCPKCGSEHIHHRGSYYTSIGRYKRFLCNTCGGWSKCRYSDFDVNKRKRLLANAASNN